ncbi:hypothetical protein OHB12_06620 [Nocardia sp. NBC_01730]|nr:hypothetical protein OHB12_06620 [Nocardia sp. NBC_01730]
MKTPDAADYRVIATVYPSSVLRAPTGRRRTRHSAPICGPSGRN